MSDFVIHKGKRPADGFARHYGSEPAAIRYAPSQNTTVLLADHRQGAGSCLGCGHAPCMEKDPAELALAAALEEYPGDPSLSVCPTDAITWDNEQAVIQIDPGACIGCGLCVVRCPYGAISLADMTRAAVTVHDPDRLTVARQTTGAHPKPPRTGAVAAMSAPAICNMPEAIAKLSDSRATLLIRNLLHELGMNARVRRRGDTNMRIDAVGYSRSERPFVAEIELTEAVLESPRALLEDVAIMHSRYGFAVHDIDAISIILTLPNVRSEYYQVIRDIESVLEVRCRTLTVGAMIALVWKGLTLDGFRDAEFAVTADGIDLGRSAALRNSPEPYLGAFRPAK